jgi:predicted membrane GTPase involved in stress response
MIKKSNDILFAVEQLEFPVLYASAKEGSVSQAYTKCTEGEE